jgi:heme/copper-type cytochrome/quinol oxidase subunit 2
MGVKVDALPGRLNQLFITPKRVGLFTGQCSEICGTNHSFIPILLKVTTPKEYLKEIKAIQ